MNTKLLSLVVLLQLIFICFAQIDFVVNDMHIDSHELIIGGSFNHVPEGGQIPVEQPELINIASYGFSSFFNYGNWTNLGAGLPNMQPVTALTSHLAANNQRIVYVAGKQSANETADPASFIAQFTAPWDPDNGGLQISSGVWATEPQPATKYLFNGNINNMYTVTNTSANETDIYAKTNFKLFVAGDFTTMTESSTGAAVAAGCIASFDVNTTTWSTMNGGVANIDGSARVSDVDDAGEYGIFVVGTFTHAGGIVARNLAQYICHDEKNCEWRSVGNNAIIGAVNAVRFVVDDEHPLLYIGGQFYIEGIANTTNAAVYNFTTNTWAGMMQGIQGVVTTIDVDDYCAYYGGSFVMNDTLISDDGELATANNIVCWHFDLQNWAALSTGLDGPVKRVRSGAIYSGPEIVFEKRLYAIGEFADAGGVAVEGLAYYVDRGYGPFNGAWVAVRTGTAINLYAFIVLGVITVISTILGVVYCVWSYKKNTYTRIGAP